MSKQKDKVPAKKKVVIQKGSASMSAALENLKNVNLTQIEEQLKAAGHEFKPQYKVLPDRPSIKGGEFGVDDTIDVIAVVLTLVKAFIEGGITNYLAALVQLPAAITGLGNVPLELADLDEEDLNQLIGFVIANFPTLPTELAQAIVEHSIKALFHIYEIIAAVIENSEDPLKLEKSEAKSKGLATT